MGWYFAADSVDRIWCWCGFIMALQTPVEIYLTYSFTALCCLLVWLALSLCLVPHSHQPAWFPKISSGLIWWLVQVSSCFLQTITCVGPMLTFLPFLLHSVYICEVMFLYNKVAAPPCGIIYSRLLKFTKWREHYQIMQPLNKNTHLPSKTCTSQTLICSSSQRWLCQHVIEQRQIYVEG